MNITITLPAATEEKLRQRAAESGQTLDSYLRQLVEREVHAVNGGRPAASPAPARLPSDDALAPFRQEVADSGMTDEDLFEFFEGVREEIHREKQDRPNKAS